MLERRTKPRRQDHPTLAVERMLVRPKKPCHRIELPRRSPRMFGGLLPFTPLCATLAPTPPQVNAHCLHLSPPPSPPSATRPPHGPPGTRRAGRRTAGGRGATRRIDTSATRWRRARRPPDTTESRPSPRAVGACASGADRVGSRRNAQRRSRASAHVAASAQGSALGHVRSGQRRQQRVLDGGDDGALRRRSRQRCRQDVAQIPVATSSSASMSVVGASGALGIERQQLEQRSRVPRQRGPSSASAGHHGRVRRWATPTTFAVADSSPRRDRRRRSTPCRTIRCAWHARGAPCSPVAPSASRARAQASPNHHDDR